jgi:hypothetical protein
MGISLNFTRDARLRPGLVNLTRDARLAPGISLNFARDPRLTTRDARLTPEIVF